MYKKTIVIKILILLLIIIASFIRPISMGKYTVSSSSSTVSESLQSTQAATGGTTKYMVATYRLPHRKCC